MELAFLNVDDQVSVIALVLGSFILIFGLVSYLVRGKIYISETLIAFIVGVIVGPYVLNIINPKSLGDVNIMAKQFTRIVIAIQVMAAGVVLPKAYLRTEFRSIIILVVPVMSWMWVVSGLAVYLFVPRLTFLGALLIASSVTPTDPGKYAEKYVPANVRDAISAESAANDEALGKWVYYIMVYQILLSVVIGFVIGYIGRKIIYWAFQRGFIDKEVFLAFIIVLAFFVLGIVGIISSDDLLASFITGDWFRKEMHGSNVQEVIDMLFNMTIFVFIGTAMPWSSYNDDYLGLSYWRLILMAIFILFFRRLPIVMALFKFMPAVKTTQEALFTGWFGPMGAVFYAQVARETFTHYNNELENPDDPNARVRDLIVPVNYLHKVKIIKVRKNTEKINVDGDNNTKGGNLDIVVINDNENPTASQQNSYTLMTLENQDQELNIINVNNHKKYAIYNDEQDNLFIKDEKDGSMYVISNNPLSETATVTITTTTAADKLEHVGDDPHLNNNESNKRSSSTSLLQGRSDNTKSDNNNEKNFEGKIANIDKYIENSIVCRAFLQIEYDKLPFTVIFNSDLKKFQDSI
ncbi:5169_t:CDS:10 [Entrophospora sp. SA101]|nr:5169_t:CDS:10 [Entrophospora sp. SA101]